MGAGQLFHPLSAMRTILEHLEVISGLFGFLTAIRRTKFLPASRAVPCAQLLVQHPQIGIDVALRADLHKLKKVTSDTGAPRFVADSDSNGHADRTWAGFLGINAASGEDVKIEFMGLPSREELEANPDDYNFYKDVGCW